MASKNETFRSIYSATVKSSMLRVKGSCSMEKKGGLERLCADKERVFAQ